MQQALSTPMHPARSTPPRRSILAMLLSSLKSTRAGSPQQRRFRLDGAVIATSDIAWRAASLAVGICPGLTAAGNSRMLERNTELVAVVARLIMIERDIRKASRSLPVLIAYQAKITLAAVNGEQTGGITITRHSLLPPPTCPVNRGRHTPHAFSQATAPGRHQVPLVAAVCSAA